MVLLSGDVHRAVFHPNLSGGSINANSAGKLSFWTSCHRLLGLIEGEDHPRQCDDIAVPEGMRNRHPLAIHRCAVLAAKIVEYIPATVPAHLRVTAGHAVGADDDIVV